MKRYAVALGLLILVALQLPAETSLWKVSRGTNHFFLGGTIHVLAERDYPLPEEFEAAFREADILILETDLAGLEGPEAQTALMAALTYPEGEGLQQHLGKKTAGMLRDYMGEYGLPLEALDRYKPGLVSSMITMLELQKLGIAGQGVDSYFAARAEETGMPSGFLETVEQQLTFLGKMGEGAEDALIASSLSDVETLEAQFSGILQAWRQGDTEALEGTLVSGFQEEFPGIYRQLLVARNDAWFPQILAMAKDKQVELILVGSAHLVGRDGLLPRLEQAGFTVEKY